MPLPSAFRDRLRLPVIAAPLFLVSGPDLVTAACRAGVIGTFPALNRRTNAGFVEWLETIGARLAAAEEAGERPAPFGVNLIVHKSNPRLKDDLRIVVEHRVPLVITSLGAVRDVVEAVHGHGGLVFHDVINLRHAEKAAAAGVDGLIAVAAGAGGHAGTLNPFPFLAELRAVFDGTIVLAGAIADGRQIAAARLLGADLAYLGTRFIATRESGADPAYKAMIRASAAGDVVYTKAVSGVHGSFLRRSLEAAGLDPAGDGPKGGLDLEGEARAWRDIWSAGQGVGGIDDLPGVGELCARLEREYREALDGAASLR